ncbi:MULTISPECIES: hypothetical protein [Caldisericum]|uniref:hypothetical protein n=1 Tax=Caldisericum TaxID=693074 RepID=UPI003C7743AD
MKKFGLITFILALLFSTSADLLCLSKIVVERGNAGSNGKYNKVNEWHYHDQNCDCDVHKLSCWDPGYIDCAWMHRPSVMRLADYAEEQIKKGILTGFYEEIIDGVRHTVEWNATDIYNANITETVYDNN